MKISVVLCLLTPTPFLRAMTEFTIKTLRAHADNEFELVVVEADGNWFDPEHWVSSEDSVDCYADKYLNFTPKIGCVRELNRGVAVASGDFIVTTGNDVIVPPHWDTELLLPFEKYKDCGVSSLSAYEPGYIVGPAEPQNRIVEGMYTPFNMFRKGWTFDESFIKIYQDSDIIFRMYEAGLRCYRSCRAHVHHLCRMTSDRVDPEKHARELAHDERLFYSRWGNSPLILFGMTRFGQVTYGKEHLAWTNPINLHYDPSKSEG